MQVCPAHPRLQILMTATPNHSLQLTPKAFASRHAGRCPEKVEG